MPACKNCNHNFEIKEEDFEFYKKVSPKFNGQTFFIPPPTHCPDCRFQRRMAWRNEKILYQSKCALCKKEMISCFPADSEYTVYCQDCWWSDKWDPEDYARENDFNKPFFENFNALLKEVPQFNLTNIRETNENCDYVNYVSHAKNCYLVFAANWLENIMYSDYIWHSKDCVDCSYCRESELCYFCMDIDNSYNCQHLQQSKTCVDCVLGYGLINCKNCFGCVNLINGEYYFFNEKLLPAEYRKKVGEIMRKQNTFNELREKFYKFSLDFPRKFAYQISCENSTGDGIKNCNNCQDVFDGEEGENLKWMINFPGHTKDCYDISGCAEIEMSMECSCSGISTYAVEFCHAVFNSQNILYSAFIDGSKNIFGSSGIRKGEYYILNKKYSQQSFDNLKMKIVEQMKKDGEYGEFFPAKISPYNYNDTVAQDIFPLEKEIALRKNYKWYEESGKKANPDVLICHDCEQNFQIIPQEEKFYKNQNIFIPDKCYKCRYKERISKRNPRKLWERKCDKCGKYIKTTYCPEKEEVIYCEHCYNKEIY